MPHPYPFGMTVQLVVRTVSGVDSDGNDTYTEAKTAVPGVPVWPATSTETQDGKQDEVFTALNAWLPPGTDPTAYDAVEVGTRRYEIAGDPGDFSRSPLTGTPGGVLVRLEKVS